MRPNFALDAPPTELLVGGFAYKIKTDYRIWLEVMEMIRNINFNGEQSVIVQEVENVEELVFGGVLADESIIDVFKAITEFLKGYPTAPSNGCGSSTSAQTYSFNYDLNEIIIAIKNQHGVDLSYRNKDGCHWWEFLLYFRTLSGEHYILNLMNARGYKGKDKDMIKRRNAVALPTEYTAEQQEEIDAFNALFDTNEGETYED